jgi:hypothetical protein
MRRTTPKKAGPRPRTVKRPAAKPKCIRGHVLVAGADPRYCRRCAEADRRAREGMPPDRYREHRRAELGLGPPPAVMIMRTADGQEVTFRATRRGRR